MLSRSQKIFVFLGRRMFVFYLIAILLIMSTFDYPATMNQVRLSVLNRLMPDFIHVAKFIEHHDRLDKSSLKDSVVCFREVVRYFPSFFEAWGILGFSYYYLGKTKQAIYAYERALEANPNNLWFYHDLGMIYFKNGEHEKAADYFKKALMVNADITLASILSSRVYIPIFQLMDGSDTIVADNIKKGYQHCYQMMVLLEYRSNRFEEALRGAQYAIKTNTEPKDFFYYFAGLAAYQLKDYKMSLYFLQESIKINPKNPESFHQLAILWRTLGKEELAVRFEQEEAALRYRASYDIENEFTPWLF